MKPKTLNQAITQVIENNPTDYQRLFSFAETWVKRQMKNFTAECLKKAFTDNGNAPVLNQNVIGAVFRKLSEKGAITVIDYTSARSPVARNHSIKVWISREFRLKQQGNRKVDMPELEFVL